MWTLGGFILCPHVSKERLKVAERVALVRLLGTFVGEASVDLLVHLWQDGKCHRDVAGAALSAR